MKNALCVICLVLSLTVAAFAVELKSVGINGQAQPVVVTIPAGQTMRIVTCVYEGVDSINGVLVSPTLTFVPGTQAQGADLHASILRQFLQQDPQGFYLAGPGRVTFNARSATGFFVNYELISSVR